MEMRKRNKTIELHKLQDKRNDEELDEWGQWGRDYYGNHPEIKCPERLTKRVSFWRMR
jgi:hypothetical protein